MKRRSLTNKQRLDLFESHGGVCYLCERPIAIGERWEVSHPVPLELGGEDNAGNRAPAHEKCHRRQTVLVDIPVIAKSKRVRQRHVGAWRSSRPLPCGRSSGLSKTIANGVVPRMSGAQKHAAMMAKRRIGPR